jgi:hypothetical protein
MVGEYPGVFRVGTVGPVVLTSWFGKLDLPAAEELASVTRRLMRESVGTRFSGIHLADRRVGLPDARTRKVLAQTSREGAGRTARGSMVVDGSGFWASAALGIVRSLQAIAPHAFDLRVFTTIEAVVEWLPREHLSRTGVWVSRDEIAQLLGRRHALAD